MELNDRMERLAREMARLLAVEKIDLDSTFASLGWDSMMVVELAIAAEVVYEKRIDFEKVHITFDTPLREIFQHVDQLLAEAPGTAEIAAK